MSEEHSNTEKRRFFRVDDDIIFDYDILDPSVAHDKKTQANDPLAILSRTAQELKQLDLQQYAHWNYIMSNEPKLGEYLSMLNQKISLLFHFVSEDVVAKLLLQTDTKPKTRVNLSAGGLGFRSKTLLAKGTMLYMKILLQPEFDYVAVEGRVVNCVMQSAEDGECPYRISVEFCDMNALDEQKIVRHIQRLEILSLQAKKPLDEQNL